MTKWLVVALRPFSTQSLFSLKMQGDKKSRTGDNKNLMLSILFVNKSYLYRAGTGSPDCGKVHWYPRYICPHCHSMNIEWIEGSGEGTIHTYAVQYRAFGGWAQQVPFVTAYIDLKEGDRMVTVLRGVDPSKPEEIRIGSKVKVEFEEMDEGLFVPFFHAVEEPA